MRKLFYADVVVVLCLVVGYVYLSGPYFSGVSVLDSEKTFDAGLHNSLYYLDLAKQKWADEKQKSEKDVPTIDELIPYLRENKVGIDKFMALGVRYTITPTGEEHQTDIATLTRDLRFHRGICRYYPAGTKLCLHAGWSSPPGSICFRLLENNLDIFLLLCLFALAVGNVLLFVMRKRPHPQST
jgi:hypothetical protein